MNTCPLILVKCFPFNIRFYTLPVMRVLEVVSLGRQTGVSFNKWVVHWTSHFYWQHWTRYVLINLFQIVFNARITTVVSTYPLPFAANKQTTDPLLLLSQKILSTQRKGLCAVWGTALSCWKNRDISSLLIGYGVRICAALRCKVIIS